MYLYRSDYTLSPTKPGRVFWKGASLPSDNSKGDPPVPISNTAVKPFSADDTSGATPWESRTLLGFFMPTLLLVK